MTVKINGTSGLIFEDGILQSYGDDNDLQINHDGSNSYINDAGTGNLRLQTGGSTKLEVTSSGIDVTGGINTTGNVGIGTSSPNVSLEVAGSIRIDNGASFTAYEVYRDNILYGQVGGASNQFTIQASNNKNVNILDDSGNGLTVKDGGNVGIGTTSPQKPLHTKGSATAPCRFERLTDNGQIIQLYKDGTPVGSIGVDSGDNIYFAGSTGGTGGIYINNSAVYPANTGGAATDNLLNLGSTSIRWKDLYLSGGVYLGGTGSANYLDDYEEGTWTPSVSVGGASTTNGNYTKIGNTVHIWGYVTGFTNTTNNEAQTITGLPFTPSASRACGSAMWDYVDSDSRYGTYHLYSRYIRIEFYDASRNSGFDNIRCIDMDSSSTSVWFVATYYTNS